MSPHEGGNCPGIQNELWRAECSSSVSAKSRETSWEPATCPPAPAGRGLLEAAVGSLSQWAFAWELVLEHLKLMNSIVALRLPPIIC